MRKGLPVEVLLIADWSISHSSVQFSPVQSSPPNSPGILDPHKNNEETSIHLHGQGLTRD